MACVNRRWRYSVPNYQHLYILCKASFLFQPRLRPVKKNSLKGKPSHIPKTEAKFQEVPT